MPTVNGGGEYVPGRRPIDDTDLEISYNMRGKDLVLRVNKAGVMVFRVLLEGAAKELSPRQLSSFSAFAPDYAFTVGDTREGIERLARSCGLTEDLVARMREASS